MPVSVSLCLLLSVSVRFCSFLSLAFRFCLSLFCFFVNFCPFWSVLVLSVCFCQFLSVSVNITKGIFIQFFSSNWSGPIISTGLFVKPICFLQFICQIDALFCAICVVLIGKWIVKTDQITVHYNKIETMQCV